MTPAEFVTARLDEQRTECDGTGEYGGCWKLSEAMERSVEAQRKILAEHHCIALPDHHRLSVEKCGADVPDRCAACHGSGDGNLFARYPCPTLRALTQQWRDHPDWDEAWG